jgi:hypothetical protein
MPETQTAVDTLPEVNPVVLKKFNLQHRSITVKISHEMFEELKYHASILEHSLAQLTIELLEGFLAHEKEKAEQTSAKKQTSEKKQDKTKKK